ncbi:MAG TPA: helix-hairpin-helix domain-containing protein [Candidatus Merdisoma merdipullorum]|nr:helix-hairpin-helix domain-containing protein [Candidatus Merdisoma merdipullorum]
MRYRWEKLFALGMLLTLLLSGCKNTALLYDSMAESEEQTQEEDALSETPLSGDASESGSISEGASLEGSGENSSSPVFVYVCGEVEKPGVYELQEGDRVVDAVEAAGGMTGEASDTWLNLAELISDGQKIEVPSREQAEELAKVREEEESGLVNLNTASEEELMTLTGIGEAKAREILNYREEHGGFQKPEELMEIPGIKEGVFLKIKDQITV